MRALALCVVAFACNSAPADDDGCPNNAPGFFGTRVTVTEGSSTSFPVYSNPWPPLIGAGFMYGVDEPDMSIVTVSPLGGGWGTSSPPPIVTATGIDDGSANGSDRAAQLGGAVLDCGAAEAGIVYVVDRESLQLDASPWELHLGVGSSAPLTIALTQAPPAPVTVAIEFEANLTIDPTTVTLDATSWSTGATTMITANGPGIGIALELDAGSDMPHQVAFVDVDP